MRKQAVRYTVSGVVAIVLIVALVVMVNWLAGRHWVRSDWTSSRIYTLSEKSTNLVAQLESDIEIMSQTLEEYRSEVGAVRAT